MAASLEHVLGRIESGSFPPADGKVTVVPEPSPGTSAVVAFTGHAVIAADVDESWVRDRVPEDDLGAPLSPPFLAALGTHLGRDVGCIDMVTLATHLDGAPAVPLAPVAGSTHPRVRRATRYRSEVTVWTTPGAVLVLGRGLAGRWEAAIEVDPPARGRGLGRALATAARHLIPVDQKVWAQISPGNAASVRAFLHAGFTPVGSEALLVK
ncbi:MAG TPA: GNAT family N-acetyltransferase [Jiangellaceae bacterium]